MGRRKLIKTRNQREAQRRRWAAVRNAKRRARYAEDSEYREQAKAQARQYAAKKFGGEHDRYLECEKSLARLDELGKERDVFTAAGGGSPCRMRVLTSREVAEAIGLSSVVILNKWQRAGRFPYPETLARVTRTRCKTYTLEQVKRFLEILSDHYKHSDILQVGDTADALMAVMQQ